MKLIGTRISMRPMVRALLAALSVVLVVGLAGCSSPDEKPAGGLVQINLPDGRSVTIPQTPTRIVTLGGQWTDVLLSFGVTPVGYYDAMKLATGTAPPWYGAKLSESTLLNPNDGLVAEIAKLDPDLIVAPGFASMSSEFAKLSEIAPTIDKISGQQVDPWQDMVTLMGTILHQPEKAQQIIGKVNQEIAAVSEKHPSLKGKTYSFAFMFGADQIQVLGDANDGAGKLFAQLGLKIAPALAEQAKKTGQPRFPISAERIGMLSSDLLVMAAQTDALRKRLEGLPGYRNLRSVRSGAVSLLDQTEITGLNEPSPNAIPYVLRQLDPALAAAADD